MSKIKKTILVAFAAVLLTACNPSPDIAIDPTKVYLGYPCADSCDLFKQGYEKARSNQFRTHSQCGSDLTPQTTGCKAYITDWQSSQDPSGGFIFVN